MTSTERRVTATCVFALAMASGVTAPAAQPREPGTVRLATFNVFELTCAKIDAVDAQGRHGGHPQLRKAAEILRRVQPDVVLINEIDYSTEPDCARHFVERYLVNPRDGLARLDLPHRVYLPVNTGVPSGLDFTNDGSTTDPGDAFGFGHYPGQYGMALFSRFPIDAGAVRTFQRFLWKDMPGHLMPDGRAGRPAHYSAEEIERFRLSSKSHWDVPVAIAGRDIHLLVSHPTPPIFDGDEDANGRRNFDEVRLWADYISGGERASYLVDDQGRGGGLAAGAPFVVLGDLNAEPVRDPAAYGQTAVSQLLAHSRVQDSKPRGEGEWPRRADQAPYPGDPSTRTSGFGRIDYVLASRDLEVVGSGVWYPRDGDPLRVLVTAPDPASDHALVWIDVRVGERR